MLYFYLFYARKNKYLFIVFKGKNNLIGKIKEFKVDKKETSLLR